ncbi:MAG: type IV pilus modification protein PilV [Betaproteobacteria bacterium]|nr:type IV pilus modification protein PilV [Betaproteobacteria bacterium]
MKVGLYRTGWPPAQRGATLVEVLVAILILTFGLLGVAGLIANSLRAANDTGNYVMASTMARELAEKMRANRQVAQATVNNPYLVDTSQTAIAAAAANCVASGSVCNANALGSWDMWDWWTRLTQGSGNDTTAGTTFGGLPNARLVVCYDNSPFNGANLVWACDNQPGAPLVVKLGWSTRPGGTGTTGAADPLSGAAQPRVVIQALPGPGV